MKAVISSDFKLGILGGGQLGRMMLRVLNRYDIKNKVMDSNPKAPCSFGAGQFIVGDINNYEEVLVFGKDCDVVTYEIESVNVEALKELERRGVTVSPSSSVLEIIQDKRIQKQFYKCQY